MSESTVIVEQQRATLVAQRAESVVVAEQPRVLVLAAGAQGPQGPAGPSGAQYGVRIAGATLGGHRVVRSLADGRIGYASADNPAHGDDTIGLTVQAAAENATVNVLQVGSIEHNGWSWVPGDPVFLDANGMLTQDPPEDLAFIQVIGHAETATSVFVSPQPPIYF